jgi:hypothetical protein
VYSPRFVLHGFRSLQAGKPGKSAFKFDQYSKFQLGVFDYGNRQTLQHLLSEMSAQVPDLRLVAPHN